MPTPVSLTHLYYSNNTARMVRHGKRFSAAIADVSSRPATPDHRGGDRMR